MCVYGSTSSLSKPFHILILGGACVTGIAFEAMFLPELAKVCLDFKQCVHICIVIEGAQASGPEGALS